MVVTGGAAGARLVTVTGGAALFGDLTQAAPAGLGAGFSMSGFGSAVRTSEVGAVPVELVNA